jgi:hypothetical protein
MSGILRGYGSNIMGCWFAKGLTLIVKRGSQDRYLNIGQDLVVGTVQNTDLDIEVLNARWRG